jgi:E1A/CREB-binding protein
MSVVQGRNQYHWCTKCYDEMKDGDIHIGGKTLRKSELTKKKNNEEPEESWVQCDGEVRAVY